MLKIAIKSILVIALGTAPVLVVSTPAHAQNDAQQRAYHAGYQNGVNDRNQNKPLNLKTDNWHGQNLSIYQRGYEDGYRGRGDDRYSGYKNPYNNNPYNHDRDNDHDRDDAYRGNGGYGNSGYVGGNYGGSYGATDAARRAYQAGFQNGVNDRRQNKQLNLKTDNWHGQNLNAYRQGYTDGYQGARRDHRHHDDD